MYAQGRHGGRCLDAVSVLVFDLNSDYVGTLTL